MNGKGDARRPTLNPDAKDVDRRWEAFLASCRQAKESK